MLSPLIFSIVSFFAVIMLCMVGYYLWQNAENLKSQNKRLEKAINIQTQAHSESPESNTDNSEGNIRRDMRISNIVWLDKLLSKFLKGRTKSIMILIEQSGLKIRVSEFILFTTIIGFIGELAVDIFLHIPIVGFAAAILPLFILNFLKVKRCQDFAKQLPQALDLLSGDLRAGLDIQTGLKHLSEEFPPPIGEEFGKVVIEINLGLSLSEALNHLSSRVNIMDVQILCTGIIINRELGGNLSELINGIADTVRERFKLQGMIKALTAENQMSALLLIGLPIVLFFILNIMSPALYNSFSTDPVGQKILLGSVVSMVFGYLVMQKITKLEV
ncbi:MAG: type II secretion system F family protein [Candidatus Melainabacteria bacterium]|nr:type II secretion system F family protein [Candidatus Melainabacteria bacterium]